MSQENYIGYQNMLTTVTTGIAELGTICTDLGMPEQAGDMELMRDRLQNHVFSVGIMGEFRRGKSTVINALLGQAVVPSDIVPTTATPNYVRWSPEKYAEIHFKDGRTQTVAVEELSGYVTKITEESAEVAATVDHAVVYYPCMFCQNGVQIVDTPGLNDDDRMAEVSEHVIPSLDAIIMVVTPDSPFSKSEAEFVRNKVMTSDLGKIIFVVNKIDLVDEDDVDRLLAEIRKRIETSVLEKTAAVYGIDSEEYAMTKSKLGEIRLLPISARNALKGRIKNDRRKFEESGYPEFEAMLSKLLTEERGILELIHPANKIQSVAKETIRTIDMRANAMRMDAVDFQKVQKESMETIKTKRKQKREEIKLLKAKGKNLYADLLPDLEASYEQMRDEVRAYVRQMPIGEEDLASEATLKAFSEKIAPQIDQQITDVLSIQTERLMNRIKEQLGKDVEALKAFGAEFASDMEAIQTNISVHAMCRGSEKKSGAGVAAAIDAATLLIGVNVFDAFIPGVGGVIAGWREHGFKGAVVGGLSGAGLAYGAMLAAGALGLVGLPLALIGGLAAAFGGKAAANLIFGKKKTSKRFTEEDVRNQLLDSVDMAIEELKGRKTLEKWLKDTCHEAYTKVAEDIDQEWENTLSNMEHTLSRIEADIEKNEAEKARLEKEMETQIHKINQILGDLKPVYEMLKTHLAAEKKEATV